ncbi:hypothetical protein WJX75_000516 [Coccomyxa subellipsoidea]|uniref:Uncharacterized protein n=1 Tax=Coccomyxa subellipsoidea TaxID=248742 RepID=A0ABR2YBV2_9CHLO
MWASLLKPRCCVVKAQGERDTARERDLQRSGHNSLIKAIHLWAGRTAVAKRLGLACPPLRQSQRLLTLGDLSLELERAVPFVLQFGVMPSSMQLLEAGRSDLVQSIKRMGGFKRVAAALEPAFLPARRGRSAAGAWSPGDVQSPLALVQFGSSRPPFTIAMRGAAAGLGLLRKQEEQESEGALVAPLLQEKAAEVQHFVAASGFSRMPTRLELKQAGRPDLVNAVTRCGGFAAVARFLGLTFKETRPLKA